jgi:hypothetical protein
MSIAAFAIAFVWAYWLRFRFLWVLFFPSVLTVILATIGPIGGPKVLRLWSGQEISYRVFMQMYLGYILSVLGVSILFGLIVSSLFSKYIERKLPMNIVTDSLVSSCAVLYDSSVWEEIQTKRMIIKDLESCATSIEKGWRIPGQDAHFREWQRRDAQEIAAAFRGFKMWAYAPQAETRNLLLSKLSKALLAVTSGEWHYLDRADPPKISATAVRSTILSVLRVVLRAALPFTLVYVWKISGLSGDAALIDRLLIAAFALGALYFMLAVDPDAGKRIESVTTMLKALGGRVDRS